jgi:MATE family multidrug resistance protein
MAKKPRELTELFRLGLPMVATQFFIMAMGFMDTAMAGHYRSVDLAGVALGGHIMWPVFMLMSGLNMALTPMSANLRGEGKIGDIGALVRQGLWLAVIASAVTVLILFNATPLLALFDVDPDAADIAIRYLDAAAWGMPGVMLYVTLRYVCEGLGHTLPPMYIAAGALVVNAALNYIFIYGKLGLPEMGGEGCGWATAITMWLQLGLILILLRRPWFKATGLMDRFEGLRLSNILRIAKVGGPIGVTVFLEMAIFSVIGLLIGSLGITALSAHSIAGNINWATFVIPMSIGSAASIRVGFFVGSGDFAYARKVVVTATKVTICYGIVASGLVLAGRHIIPGIYSADPAVLALASQLLIILAVYLMADCIQATTVGCLRGYKDTRVPMVISFAGYWMIALPLGVVLGFGYVGSELGVFGFWMGMAVGLVIVAILACVRLYQTATNDERIARFLAI